MSENEEFNLDVDSKVEKVSKSELENLKKTIEAEKLTMADNLIEMIENMDEKEIDEFILALKPVLKNIIDRHNKKI